MKQKCGFSPRTIFHSRKNWNTEKQHFLMSNHDTQYCNGKKRPGAMRFTKVKLPFMSRFETF